MNFNETIASIFLRKLLKAVLFIMLGFARDWSLSCVRDNKIKLAGVALYLIQINLIHMVIVVLPGIAVAEMIQFVKPQLAKKF